MAQVKTYNPKRVIIVYGGVPITGYADGTFISVAPSSDRFSKTVGADGEVARSKSNDNTHEVTITLLSTSLSNSYLSGILTLDKISDAGALPLQIIDLSGGELFFWPQAWIRTPPTADFSKEISERAWVFDTGQAVQEFIGGDVA